MRLPRRGFTLMEMLAVLFLIALGFGVAISAFSGSKARLKRAAQMMTQDLQTLFVKAIEDSTIYKVSFPEENTGVYIIEKYQPPMKKPNEDDREAYQKWEELQREIDALPLEDRKRRTLLERGNFARVKVRELPTSVEIERINSSRFEEGVRAHSIFFLPSGEMDQALIILKSQDLRHSLETNPLTGRVSLTKNEITESDWKDKLSGGP